MYILLFLVLYLTFVMWVSGVYGVVVWCILGVSFFVVMIGVIMIGDVEVVRYATLRVCIFMYGCLVRRYDVGTISDRI